jgi:hypothetical protein
VATLVLLPIFVVGITKSLATLRPLPPASILRLPSVRPSLRTSFGAGRLLLLITAGCLVLGGLIIMTVGMTTVFVPQDLEFMGVAASELQAVNPGLIPLIAHDRAGFGGGVACCGLTMFFCIYCGRPSPSLWLVLLIAGAAGFGTAIGVHFPIGYMTLSHLAPAYFGALMFATGMTLTLTGMVLQSPR